MIEGRKPVFLLPGAIALLALLPSWLGLAGDWHWCLDLFAHFRWQYLLVTAVIIVWAAWGRRRGMAVLAVATFLLNAILISRLALHPDVSSAATGDFRLQVLSLNVLTPNPDKQAVRDYALASDADVVFFMEVDPQWMTALAPLATKYPYRLEFPRADNFGVALFSRIPWTAGGMLPLGNANQPAIEVRMTYQGHDFALIGTHPPPPSGRRFAAQRDRKLGLLAAHVAQMNVPTLVVGDLNSTPWSAGMRIATSGNLGFRSLAPPWTPTWSVRSIFAVPIDHALVTAPLVITRRSVGPDVGSDHRPLNITVGWSN